MNEWSATVCLCWFAASRCNCRQWSADWLAAITGHHQTNCNYSSSFQRSTLSSSSSSPTAATRFLRDFSFQAIAPVLKISRRHNCFIFGGNLTQTFELSPIQSIAINVSIIHLFCRWSYLLAIFLSIPPQRITQRPLLYPQCNGLKLEWGIASNGMGPREK